MPLPPPDINVITHSLTHSLERLTGHGS